MFYFLLEAGFTDSSAQKGVGGGGRGYDFAVAGGGIGSQCGGRLAGGHFL